MNTDPTQLINTKNLKQWAEAFGQPLPGMEARASLFETFGIGPRGSYIGTARQNDRLLLELKRHYGLL